MILNYFQPIQVIFYTFLLDGVGGDSYFSTLIITQNAYCLGLGPNRRLISDVSLGYYSFYLSTHFIEVL